MSDETKISSSFQKEFKNIFNHHLENLPIKIPAPRQHDDVVTFQMEDMMEKVADLESQIKNCAISSKNDPNYKRLSEDCVKFSIQLDNIVLVGREDERKQRRELLARLDAASTTLIRQVR